MSEHVETFVEVRASHIDPAWQISAGDKLSERRRQQQASERAQFRTKSFKKFLGAFVKQTKRDDIRRFDVDRQFRWEDVKSMASDAIERDTDKRWRRNPFRAAGRSLQQSASNLEMLMAFLPNGEFTGILCGALTLVFCAARRLDEVRNKILGCLESLPEIVGQTEQYVEIYDDDPKVWIAAEDLYMGILDGVEGMLLWIDKSAFERAFKALLLPATFGQDVEENSIKRGIEDKVAHFREVVQVNLHRRIGLLGEQYKTVQTLLTQLKGQLKQANWLQENPQAVVLMKTSFINLNQLRNILNVNPQLLQNDIATSVVDAQNVCSPDLTARALGVLRNPKFNTWLLSNFAHILLINGRMQLNGEQEGASPLTILSCILSQAVSKQSDRSLPLLYLCGQHNAPDDPFAGPSGMLRFINSQLAHAVRQEDADLSGIDMAFVDGIKAQTQVALRALFRLLLPAAIGRVVFVIIDGTSWMEEGPFAQDFGSVVVFWRELVNEVNLRRPGFLLKVLLTNPSTSLYGHEWLPEGCILEMDDVEEDVEASEYAESYLL
ncbi:hypothetical protein CPLU01_08025 [Colletotrichum plurivorum]|uniref:Uncharacterized protein n=1 Tax=Colletotrichum plurivorum TaxID=2175906 RepID=A0A8H6NE70_9PEZI|nr:hypothetical protein CPLU01_08025 [Colletotrichum plurivorum]